MGVSPSNPFLHFGWSDLRPGPARSALERSLDRSVDDAERIRTLRKVLSLESVIAHCMVFDLYQLGCMNSSRGPSNALEELLGVMRVKAVAILRRPDGPKGKKHVAAAQVIARAPRPKDIPLILSRLDGPADTELNMFLYWALEKVAEELETPDMTLIEAMERRLVPGREATCDRVEASRVLLAHRVKAAEEALLRALPRLAPNEAIPVAIALLVHDPVRHLDLARRIRDALPEGYPTEEDANLGMGHWHGVLRDEIESAEQKGVEVMASRARVAAIRENIDADPTAALAPLLMTRLRRACAEDAADACTILRALAAESQLYRDVVDVASSSPIPEVRDTVAALLAEEEARRAAEDAAEAAAEAARASAG